MNDETEQRAVLGAGIRSLIDELTTTIGPSEAAMIVQFVDHDELGVAYEMLRDLLIEEQTPVTAATRASLVELARSMDLDAREAELRPGFAAT